jgi:UDP-glucuronate decarboxylase
MNVGNDEETSVKDLAMKVIHATGTKSDIEFLPALKEGDMTRRRPDNAKMKSILNRPLINIDLGLKKTLENKMF